MDSSDALGRSGCPERRLNNSITEALTHAAFQPPKHHQCITVKQCQKNSSHKYTNATAFSNAAIRFIRPADETMRTANPVRYFANCTLHACDVTSNQRPSSHLSSHITGSPVRSSYEIPTTTISQFANYQTPDLHTFAYAELS